MTNIFKYYWLYLAFSMLVILPGFFIIATQGLKLSIDFTGGSLIEVKIDNDQATEDSIRAALADEFAPASVQKSGSNSFILREKPLNNQQKDQLIAQLQQKFSQLETQRFESVGPVLGRELLIKTMFAIIVVSIVITLYIMRQFAEAKYGISAVLAMLHDSAVLISVFAVLGAWRGIEIDVLFVTALLTTLSFSVHDTIVEFDRIRELKKKHHDMSLQDLAQAAFLQTVTRSLNNSLTIIFMLLALVLLGGETLRYFAVALLVGAVTGTYSSSFTAIPFLLLMSDMEKKWLKSKK